MRYLSMFDVCHVCFLSVSSVLLGSSLAAFPPSLLAAKLGRQVSLPPLNTRQSFSWDSSGEGAKLKRVKVVLKKGNPLK